jgi:hypothetical protein
MTQKQEPSTPDEGPASLREALLESFDEQDGGKAAEPESTDSVPTDDAIEPAASAVDEAEESQGDEPSDEEPVIQAPEHWSDEDRATFETLPGDAQDYLLKREKQYEKGIQEKSEKLAELDKLFEPYDAFLQMRGIDRTAAIQAWINAQSALDANPVEAIKTMAKGYGDEVFDQLFGTPDNTGPDDSFSGDPELDQARREVQKEKQELEQQTRNAKLQQQQQAAMEIQGFRDEKDDSGNLTHPYFEKAIPLMQSFLATGQAVNLQEAYEKSVWSIPEFREEQQKTLLQESKKDESKKRQEAADKAKKVAKTVNGSGSKPPPPKTQPSLRDDLIQAFDDSIRGEL